MFDFEGNGVVINLHASMKEPEKFTFVLKVCLTIYVTALCIFSTVAYWVSKDQWNLLTLCCIFLVFRAESGGYGYPESPPWRSNIDGPSFLLFWTYRQLSLANNARVRDRWRFELLQADANDIVFLANETSRVQNIVGTNDRHRCHYSSQVRSLHQSYRIVCLHGSSFYFTSLNV